MEKLGQKSSAEETKEQKAVDSLTHRPDQNLKDKLSNVVEVIDSLP
ncbi:hypothetical protein [Sporomusa malonica]|uniref:Uncharacterized protein n=1 Tax=Sporomusa malonica TaxID=112901 RepID=A0A1W1Z9S5_9FIRM|nr:hypothetical protein [Sporomusa malonica]SMC45180.1 hypothetical protein SAMN04488500_103115 [Sporomusa malonica]